MSGTKALTRALIWSILAVGVFGTGSAMASSFVGDRGHRGGYVKPCSMDGVNPVYHPDIFANPALARAYYGSVRGRDGTGKSRTIATSTTGHVWIDPRMGPRSARLRFRSAGQMWSSLYR